MDAEQKEDLRQATRRTKQKKAKVKNPDLTEQPLVFSHGWPPKVPDTYQEPKRHVMLDDDTASDITSVRGMGVSNPVSSGGHDTTLPTSIKEKPLTIKDPCPRPHCGGSRLGGVCLSCGRGKTQD